MWKRKEEKEEGRWEKQEGKDLSRKQIGEKGKIDGGERGEIEGRGIQKRNEGSGRQERIEGIVGR